MCNDRASFQSFKRLPTPCEIRLGDGHVVHALYHGLVELHVDLIVDALYVPEFQLSLLSVRSLDRSTSYCSTKAAAPGWPPTVTF
jgi:hypothetical protein